MTGDQFRAARTRLGLSYTEMAGRLGVFSTTVRAWEKRETVRPMAFYALLGMLQIENDPRLQAVVSKRQALARQIVEGRTKIEGIKSLRFSARTVAQKAKAHSEIKAIEVSLKEKEAELAKMATDEASIRAAVRQAQGF